MVRGCSDYGCLDVKREEEEIIKVKEEEIQKLKQEMDKYEICAFGIKKDQKLIGSKYHPKMRKNNPLHIYLFNKLYRFNTLRKLERKGVNLQASDIGGVFNKAVKLGLINHPLYTGRWHKLVMNE